jgi:hypothetical protein
VLDVNQSYFIYRLRHNNIDPEMAALVKLPESPLGGFEFRCSENAGAIDGECLPAEHGKQRSLASIAIAIAVIAITIAGKGKNVTR